MSNFEKWLDEQANSEEASIDTLQMVRYAKLAMSRFSTEEQVVMPKVFAERLLEYISDLQDEGPSGQGWRSKKLIADMNILADLLDYPHRW